MIKLNQLIEELQKIRQENFLKERFSGTMEMPTDLMVYTLGPGNECIPLDRIEYSSLMKGVILG